MSQDQAAPCKASLPPVGEEDLRLYLGPRAAAYIAVWDRGNTHGRSPRGQAVVLSWNWWGLIFPIPWLFYRKLWAIGATLVLLPILLDATMGFGAEFGLLLAASIGALGKPLVIERAERKVRAVDALGLYSQDSIDRLRRAGGVSVPGAVIGAFLMAASLGLQLYGNLPAQLPGCGSTKVRATVLDIARSNPDQTGLEGEELRLEGITRSGTSGGGKGRLCFAELGGGNGSLAIEYEISWQSRKAGRYVVDLRIREDAP